MTDAGMLDCIVRFEDDALTGLAPITRDKRQGHLLRFARWLQPKGLLDATSEDIIGWLDSISPNAKTRADRISALHSFYNWALNLELVDRDPAAPMIKVRRPLAAGDFPDTIRAWWVSQERRNLAPSTIAGRARGVRRLHDWLAPRTVYDATAADLEAWLDSCRLAPRARYKAISDLHGFYRWACRHGIVETDPTDEIDRPRLPQAVPRPITPAHLGLALDRADAETAAMLYLAAFAGLRSKEIAGVRREDILEHLDPPVLIVTAPKGNRQRTLPLHPQVWAALAMRLPRSGFVFPSANGDARPPWKISATVNGHLHSLGIPASCHQLRHYFGTNVYANSLDLRLTQELMGHSSPTTTACYVQFNRSGAADVVGSLTVPL